MSGKTIVILGAGVGGLVAANELRRLLPAEHRVVLVEKNARHAFAPSFLWLMTGDRRPEQIARDVRQLVRPGIEVIVAEAQAIDLANRRVQTSVQSVNYDYLIIALGADLAPEAIPGLAEGAHTYYTFDGAAKLRDALQAFNGGKVAVVVSALPYKCPGAPHEGAMLIADTLRKRGLRNKSEAHLFTPEPQPMPVAGPVLGDAVKQMLTDKAVAFHPLHKLTAVNASARELSFEGKESFTYDLLVAIPPHRGPRLAREAGLTNEAGWVPVDRATLKTKPENVYAIGDATVIPIPGRWKPDVPLVLPKAGVFAHAQAEVVAHRIAAEIAGAETQRAFFGDGYCMLEAGEDLAGFAYGNFFAEPSPQIELRQIGSLWHWGKVLLEQWWLAPYGPRREALRLALTLGGKGLGIPVVV
ncbi:MAG TPA: FAD/NAD(P)-binding oxidoreductase [Anaerolineales bacterium]|nr:FAD/NAD(P)-binding oxidoreductase [Anaerolineales bacterium]